MRTTNSREATRHASRTPTTIRSRAVRIGLLCACAPFASGALPQGSGPYIVHTLAQGPAFGEISGLVVSPTSGEIYVSAVQAAGPSAIRVVNAASGSAVDLLSGLPLSWPGRLVFGDGTALTGTDLVVADWNSVGSAPCCNGQTMRLDLQTGVATTLYAGTPGATVGDPFGLALSPGGAYPPGLFVLDFQGASTQDPLVYRITAPGSASPFATSPTAWPGATSALREIAADPTGSYGGNLFVLDQANGQIHRVMPTGTVLPFTTVPVPGNARAMAFSPGGTFGTSLYVLTALSGSFKVYTVDPAGTPTLFLDNLAPIAGTFGALTISPDGSILYVGTGDTLIQVLDCGAGSPLGTSICSPAQANSTGVPGTLLAVGSPFASAGSLTLHACALPPGQFGYFLASRTEATLPVMPPGSAGFLCLAGSIGRFNAAGQVIVGPIGVFDVPTGAIPLNPTVAIQPGDAWSFQCWYRDSGGTSNFTDAVRITYL